MTSDPAQTPAHGAAMAAYSAGRLPAGHPYLEAAGDALDHVRGRS